MDRLDLLEALKMRATASPSGIGVGRGFDRLMRKHAVRTHEGVMVSHVSEAEVSEEP